MYTTPRHWKSDVVKVNGIQVHYTRTGGDKPALLLLHGATDNGLCWTRIAKVMESEYDVIMPDARAHGKSEMGSVDDLSFETMADDTAMLIKELKLDKPKVVGHSMGGQTATILAGKYPDLVSKIILEDPAYGLKKAGLRSKIMILVMMFMIYRNKKKNEEQIRKLLKWFAFNWSDEEAFPWAVAQKEFANNAGLSLFRKLDLKYDWRPVFPKVSVPALLIIPSKGMTKMKDAEEISSIFKTGQVASIPDSGHNVRRDQYELFMEATRKFLAD